MRGVPKSSLRGWLLYDADCGFCTRWAWRMAPLVEPRGYRLVPLQAPWVTDRLALPPEELLREMRILTVDGSHYGGADAFVFLAWQILWARPFARLAGLPGIIHLLRAAYRWVARHRHCGSRVCQAASPVARPNGRASIARHPSGAHR
jgi:predicted DCC family thiol-disulfide oxidoreductase YuxK